jgi:hypothetical protein
MTDYDTGLGGYELFLSTDALRQNTLFLSSHQEISDQMSNIIPAVNMVLKIVQTRQLSYVKSI